MKLNLIALLLVNILIAALTIFEKLEIVPFFIGISLGLSGLVFLFRELEKREEKETLLELKRLVSIQGRDGNWNYDPYMHGMFNGMELISALSLGEIPVFKEAPDVWVKDETSDEIPTVDGE